MLNAIGTPIDHVTEFHFQGKWAINKNSKKRTTVETLNVDVESEKEEHKNSEDLAKD